MKGRRLAWPSHSFTRIVRAPPAHRATFAFLGQFRPRLQGFDRFMVADIEDRGLKIFSIKVPGMEYPIIVPRHHGALTIRMFRASESGAEHAIDARAALGPEWRAIVAKGPPNTCL